MNTHSHTSETSPHDRDLNGRTMRSGQVDESSPPPTRDRSQAKAGNSSSVQERELWDLELPCTD